METPDTVTSLFDSVLLGDDDAEEIIEDDFDDSLVELLESTRKISIFDSEFLLEGESL